MVFYTIRVDYNNKEYDYISIYNEFPRELIDFNNVLKRLVGIDVFNLDSLKSLVTGYHYDISEEGIFDKATGKELILKRIDYSKECGALFKIVGKKKGAPPGGTNKPGGEMNISKSDIQGHYYYITSQAICQAPPKKTPDRSRAFSPKGVKQESHTVQGNRPATAHYGAAWQKNYWRLPNPYVSKYIIPHIRRNVKR